MTNINVALPETFLFKAGQVVWSKSEPSQKFKILETYYDYAMTGTKQVLIVENQKTKEKQMILSDWAYGRDPTTLWGQDKENAEMRSIDYIKKHDKPKDLMSAEFKEGKKVSEILASWNKVTRRAKDTLQYNIAQELTNKTRKGQRMIDSWVSVADYRQAPDGMYWIFTDDRRIACKIGDDEELKNTTYFIHNSKVDPRDFFEYDSVYDSKRVVISTFGNKYLLKLYGKKYLISKADLEEWCEDNEILVQQVKERLTSYGQWSQ